MQNWARVIPIALATGKLPSLHHPLSKRLPTVAAQDVGLLAAELLPGEPRGIVSIEGLRRVSALDVARALGNASGREIGAYEVPRDEWPAMLLRAGLGADHAQLVIDLYDTHNAGRIDVEEGVGEQRFGTTEFAEVMASMLPDNAAVKCAFSMEDRDALPIFADGIRNPRTPDYACMAARYHRIGLAGLVRSYRFQRILSALSDSNDDFIFF